MKTIVNDGDVLTFLNKVENEKRRTDSLQILTLMKEITGLEPKMWGGSIVGFGQYHYQYASGHEGDMCLVGFSPRKASLTIYIMPGFEKYDDLMQQLGKYKTGKSCLYIKKLEDVNLDVLEQLILESFQYMDKKYNQ